MAHNEDTQELILRAPGRSHAGNIFFAGKFPTGVPKELKPRPPGEKRSKACKMFREEAQTGPARRWGREEATQPWILEDSTGQQSHRGKIERPLSNAASGTGYFMFIQEGSELVPLPVSEWYTFKPANRKTQFKTLEEAERAIKNSRSSEGGPEGRLAQWTRDAEEKSRREDFQGREVGEDSGDDGDEFPELEDEEEPGASGRAKKQPAEKGEEGGASDEDERPEADVDDDVKAGGGEDWEHEEENADDDVDMGEQEEGVEDAPTGSPKREEEEDRVIGAAEETQGLLERAGLGDDDSDDESLAEAGDDDEDLDEMASGLEAKKSAPAGLQPGASRKRSRTPEVAPAAPAVPKKQRKDKASPAPSPAPAPAPAPGYSSPALGPPTEAEMREVLRVKGPMKAKDFGEIFRARIQDGASKKNFQVLLKGMIIMEDIPPGSGIKFIRLK